MSKADTTTPQPQKSRLEEIGGEPLADSGFEQETPDSGFSDEQPDRQ